MLKVVLEEMKKIKNPYSQNEMNFYDEYIAATVKEENAIRSTLRSQGPFSSPPSDILTDDQIDEVITEKLYTSSDKNKTIKAKSAKDYFEQFVVLTSEDMIDPISRTLELAGIRMNSLEQTIDVLPDLVVETQYRSPGTTSETHGHVHSYQIDSKGEGKADKATTTDEHEHKIKKWKVEPYPDEDGHVHELELLEEEKLAPAPTSITTQYADLRWGSDAPGNDKKWADSDYNRMGGKNSTLMQQHFIDANPGGVDNAKYVLIEDHKVVDKPATWTAGGKWTPATYKTITHNHVTNHKHQFGYDGVVIPIPDGVTIPPGSKWTNDTTKEGPKYPNGPSSWGQNPGTGAPRQNHVNNPIIRLCVPYRGHSEIDQHTATYFTFTLNSTTESFHPRARVFLVGLKYGNRYEFLPGPPRQAEDDPEDRGYLHKDGHYPGQPNPEYPTEAVGYVKELKVTMPIQCYGAWGAEPTRENLVNPDSNVHGHTTDPTWKYNSDNNIKVRFGNGHIDEMNGKIVVDDLYSLVVQNPDTGKTGTGPMYFHTFTTYQRAFANGKKGANPFSGKDSLDHYDDDGFITVQGDQIQGSLDSKPHVADPASFTSGEGKNLLAPQWTNCFGTNGGSQQITKAELQKKPADWPSSLPFHFGPRLGDDILGAPTQAFPVGVYGEDTERWDILDVADVVGVKRDKVASFGVLEQPQDAYRDTVLCKPRLVRGDQVKKLGGQGGFILEKYVKIKFKTSAEIHAIAAGKTGKQKIALENIANLLFHKAYGNPFAEGNEPKWKEMVSITQAPSSGRDFGFEGATAISQGRAASWQAHKVIADKYKLRTYNESGALTAPASDYQILSYDAFIRLQKHISDFLPGEQKFVLRKSFNRKSYKDFIDDFKYGLRVSYVLPVDPENWKSYRPIIRNMFSPTANGRERIESGENAGKYTWVSGQAELPPDPAVLRHLTRVKSVAKAYHMVEYEGSGPGAIIPPEFSLPKDSLSGGLRDNTTSDLGILHSSQEDLDEAQARTFADAVGASVTTSTDVLTVAEYIEKYANDKKHTALRVETEVCVIPLVEAEIDVPAGPISTFQDLRSGYPSEKNSYDIPLGKDVYDTLYRQLRNKPEFKLLFEYILPTKRMLSMNTIYNMLMFESLFPDPKTFDKIFRSSTDISLRILTNAMNNPSGKQDLEKE